MILHILDSDIGKYSEDSIVKDIKSRDLIIINGEDVKIFENTITLKKKCSNYINLQNDNIKIESINEEIRKFEIKDKDLNLKDMDINIINEIFIWDSYYEGNKVDFFKNRCSLVNQNVLKQHYNIKNKEFFEIYLNAKIKIYNKIIKKIINSYKEINIIMPDAFEKINSIKINKNSNYDYDIEVTFSYFINGYNNTKYKTKKIVNIKI